MQILLDTNVMISGFLSSKGHRDSFSRDGWTVGSILSHHKHSLP
jgi:predicted nucleic acid-binding protein